MVDNSNATLDRIADLIASYKPSENTKLLVTQTQIMVLVGISGAGKGTIWHKLLETGKYERFVSATTRAPRSNHGVLEQDGVDYHFVSMEESLQMLENGEYIEANIYSGNVYGTTVSEIVRVKESGKIAITDIDVNGVANYKRLSPDVIAVFILPPNFEEWQRRLLARYGEGGPDPDDMRRRMQTAIEELTHALDVDYYHYIVNDDLEQAVAAANSIAHHGNEFTSIDDVLHTKAQELLADLKFHVQDLS